MNPLVALLTDFGTTDHYVGAMKGVVLGICGDAVLVDITHDIAPQDVTGGALALAAACPFFPPRTIFVAVVDPGVGSARRGVAAEAGDHIFVGPDNGVLSLAIGQRPTRAVELVDPHFMLPVVTRTFEGRDRFAPAAAWIARGTDLDRFGPRVDQLHQLHLPSPRITTGAIVGEVLMVDRFGNLITNIDEHTMTQPEAVRVSVAGHEIAPIATYSDVPAGQLCALVGSSGRLEIAVNGGSAARQLGVGRGAVVTLAVR